MKVRVWTGRETLSSIRGREVDGFPAFEQWLSTAPDGEMQVFAGRWWSISKESHPFILRAGRAACSYPPYHGLHGRDPADFPGFFAYEAWKIARKLSDFYAGIPLLASDIADAAKDHDNEI